MKHSHKGVALALLLGGVILGWTALALGQCSSWGPKSAPAVAGYEWYFLRFEGKADDDHAYLFLGGAQQGGWDYDKKQYRPYYATNRQWGAPVDEPPAAAPAIPPRPTHVAVAPESKTEETAKLPPEGTDFGKKSDTLMNFGLGKPWLETQRQCVETGTCPDDYQMNGVKSCKLHSTEAIKGKLIDDSKRLRLTIIGAEAERKKVREDLASNVALTPLLDHLLVQDYAPTDWAVQCGFKTDGKPTIYLQAPDGKVLHRADAYAGPDNLASAIRKADESYRPDADPDLTGRRRGYFLMFGPWTLAALALLAVYILIPKGER
jgi:hypothetical protein